MRYDKLTNKWRSIYVGNMGGYVNGVTGCLATLRWTKTAIITVVRGTKPVCGNKPPS